MTTPDKVTKITEMLFYFGALIGTFGMIISIYSMFDPNWYKGITGLIPIYMIMISAVCMGICLMAIFDMRKREKQK